MSTTFKQNFFYYFLKFLSLLASCYHTMHFDELVGWVPTCEIDGTYAARQCRGDKLTGRFYSISFFWRISMKIKFYLRCFCYAEGGERIHGWAWWNQADNMKCACSRQRFEAEKSGRLDVTLHCEPNGDYEELQCEMGICWCADKVDGHIKKDTFAVPDSLWTYLPCCRLMTFEFYRSIREKYLKLFSL